MSYPVPEARLCQLMAECRRFLTSDRGTSLPLVAVLTIPIMGFIGLSVDAGRGYLVKARLGDALDAAVLAGAHVADDAQIDAEIRKYFDANFPPGYMGATVTLSPAQVNAVSGTITIGATADISTTFLKVVGKHSMQIGTGVEVTRETVSMDVVISVDMSGSMDDPDGSGGTRIEAARTAAHTLVDVLYGNKSSADTLTIGLVPWNGAVNVMENGTTYVRANTTTTPVSNFTNPWTGSTQSNVYTPANTPVPFLRNPVSDWNGCVFARYRNFHNNPDGIADHLLGPVTTADNTEWTAWEPIEDRDDDDDDDDSYSWCLDQGITRLTDQRTTIENAIDDLTDPRNATNIAQGLSWAWRVLSPGEPFDDAVAFPTGFHERAIVLLTDGEQQGTSNDGYDRAFGSGTSAGAGMDARLRAIAANIKAGGVKIYVIQFFFNDTDLQNLLKDIASGRKEPYYHFAPNGAALNKAFKEIADDLSALRISR